MRLGIINQFYVPDLAPTGHMAASLAEHRAALGDTVTVVTSTGGYVPESSIVRGQRTPTNPRIHRLWTPGAGKSTAAARLVDYTSFFLLATLRMLTLPRQEVIVSLTTPPFIAWTAVAHKLLHPSCKIALWNMDCYPEIAERTGVIQQGGLLSKFLRWLNRRLFRQLALVVCLDKAMENLLKSSYAPSSGGPDWLVIPNWEASADFPADAAPPEWTVARQLGLEDSFVVLYLGNAGFGHNFETILASAQRLADDGVQFLFVGGGSKWNWLQTEVARLGLDNIHLVTYVPKDATPSVMASADCALITLNENAVGVVSPSKLHAYLAMGMPILYVGPEGGNIHEALDQFRMGASIRHGEIEEVVAFIKRLNSDPAFRDEERRRSRAAFDDTYVDNVTLPRFDDVLVNLLSQTSTGSEK